MSDRKTYGSLDEFLRDLPSLAELVRDRLRGNNGNYLLRTTDGQVWKVSLTDGMFAVGEPEQENYDCTVIADRGTLLDIINGKANAVKAVLTRKIRTEGNIAKLMPLLRML